MRKHLIWMLGLVVAAGSLAMASTASAVPNSQTIKHTVAPTLLPANPPGEPVSLDFEVAATNSGNPFQVPNPTTLAKVDFDNDFKIQQEGLAALTTNQVQTQFTAATTTEQARAICENPDKPGASNAVIGQGGATVLVPTATGAPPIKIKAEVLACNVEDNQLLLHQYNSLAGGQVLLGKFAPTQPAADPYATTLTVPVPPLAGGSAVISQLQTKLQKVYDFGGEQRSVISATCNDGTQLRARFTDNQGQLATGTSTQECGSAAQQVITSSGPLNNIYLNDNLACQVDHTGDTAHEFYDGSDFGACGTFIHTGGTVYGPDVPAGEARAPYGLVSQTGVTGSGTSADPYKVVTVVDVGSTGLRITQTDSYLVGDEFYRSDIVVSNSTGSDITAALYHAGDCFLQNSDVGYGFHDSSGGGIYCSVQPNNSPPDRIEGFVPLSAGSNPFESCIAFSANASACLSDAVWFAIDGSQFPNTCDCTALEDNGAGLSWSITVPANGSVTRSLLTAFSLDGVGSASARGTDPDATLGAATVAASYSAITNCDEAQSTRPFYVRWTGGTTSHLFKKDAGAATASTCVSEGDTSVNEGTATGKIDGTPGATVEWSFVDGSAVPGPDNVNITVTPAAGDLLDIAGAPQPLSGTPGGVWVFGELPWPAGGGA